MQTRDFKILVFCGAPRSGKDTAINEIMKFHGENAMHFSSIQPVVDLCQTIGIDTSPKTNRDRQLLASLKTALEDHSAYVTNKIVKKAHDCHANGHGLFITQIREVSGILMLKRLVDSKYPVSVIRVRNAKAENNCPPNHADQDWQNIIPDIDLDNNSSLQQYKLNVSKMIMSITMPDNNIVH
jgi:hypothetical protein